MSKKRYGFSCKPSEIYFHVKNLVISLPYLCVSISKDFYHHLLPSLFCRLLSSGLITEKRTVASIWSVMEIPKDIQLWRKPSVSHALLLQGKKASEASLISFQKKIAIFFCENGSVFFCLWAKIKTNVAIWRKNWDFELRTSESIFPWNWIDNFTIELKSKQTLRFDRKILISNLELLH